MSVTIKKQTKQKTSYTLLQVRLDNTIKSELDEILETLGLSCSQAVMLYVKQIILKKKIPFDLNIYSAKYEDKELNPESFRKMTGYIVNKLDQGEEIP